MATEEAGGERPAVQGRGAAEAAAAAEDVWQVRSPSHFTVQISQVMLVSGGSMFVLIA